MRRREKEGAVPAHLAAFDERDWPGRSFGDRFALWREARTAWAEVNDWPGGPLARLRDESDLRRCRAGLPLWSWGRTPAELDFLFGADPGSPDSDVSELGGN